jgi:hypothetical protein
MALAVQIILSTGTEPIRLVNPARAVAMVAEEAIDRMARTFRRMCSPSNLPALNLPLEIMLMIATHLDECTLVSLALTCRSLHGLWNPRYLPLQLAGKEKLLLLLERDIPFLYYCHYCIKLHHWHGRWSRSIAPWYQERLPCKNSLEKRLYHLPTCSIPYYHARLVMNRHIYGSKHGLPLNILKNRAHSITHEDGGVCSVSQHARIFKDQLLVLSVITMTHLRGDSVSLRDRIDEYGWPVCEHLTLSQGYPDSIPTQLPELARKGNASRQFLTCGPAFGSCTFCLTDYTINIIWQGARKGYKIEVLVHRGLGDCRTPFNWHWRTISIRYPTEQPRSAHLPDQRPGSIRDQWNKAGGAVDSTDGAWWRAKWR